MFIDFNLVSNYTGHSIGCTAEIPDWELEESILDGDKETTLQLLVDIIDEYVKDEISDILSAYNPDIYVEDVAEEYLEMRREK